MKMKNETMMEHLKELRKGIIISLIAFLMGALVCYFYLDETLMSIVFNPIRHIGKDVVLTGVAEGFMIQLKLACIGGIILSAPIILWQIIWFVLPALYKNEMKVFIIYFSLSLVLFISGIMLGYLYVLGIGLHTFLIDYNKGFATMISASRYMSFVISFLLPFGLIFQIPLITYFLSYIGVIKPSFMKKKRAYAILIILIFAAVLTPPDILSQILLSLPMILLYEISILIAVFVDRKRKRKQSQ